MFFGNIERPPRLSEFNLEIPDKLIGQYPSKKRDECKLMILNKKDGSVQHKKFKDITSLFNKGDVLVLNNTQVFSARLYASKEKSTSKVEVFLLRELDNDLWEAMVKPARKVRIGNKLYFNNEIACDVIDNTVSGGRVLRFEFKENENLYSFIDKHGNAPLPPYIKRESEQSDKKNYQTVYATRRGSVAAPTAGIHFTKPMLNAIQKKGVDLVYVTLHIGLGTFRDVEVEDLSKHKMDSEEIFVNNTVSDIINQGIHSKKRR